MIALVTGGAGFIGSNLVRRLVADGARVRVLDDLSTGSRENIRELDGMDLHEGDVRDPAAVGAACAGADVVFHLAALPSVARSVTDPLASNGVNVGGTLTVLEAARAAGVRRVVFASSSSVYGDTPVLPKHEDMPSSPRSPYAASKLAGEGYCLAYAHAYGLETVPLRFFNVFGPRQDPASEYAAVVPRFVMRMLAGESPVIYGDGSQTRDFTYVDNAVQACVLAATAAAIPDGPVNVACGERLSLLGLVTALREIIGPGPEPVFEPPRPGDVRDSQASIERVRAALGYQPAVSAAEGLRRTVEWFAEMHPRPEPAAAGRG